MGGTRFKKGPWDEGTWSSVCWRRLVYGDEMGESVVTETAEEDAGGDRKVLGEVVVQLESEK